MKAHLCSSEDPVADYSWVVALCGQEFPVAHQVFMWDQLQMGSDLILSAVTTCRTCIDRARADMVAQSKRRYIYGIVYQPLGKRSAAV
jgi:hypothetical protein